MRQTDLTPHEHRLCHALNDLPNKHQYHYTPQAQRELLLILFGSLANNDEGLIGLFFPNGNPEASGWELRTAQGAEEGAEYTAGARGKACGHIFKSGETIYRCRTCGLDNTCVLCSKCFDSSEHSGHAVSLSVSPGNSGCCDCGDHEAWRIPVVCAIHSDLQDHMDAKSTDSSTGEDSVSPELSVAIKSTVGRALDYICDVISCSPEHLRGNKTEAGLRADELSSRLDPDIYGGDVETGSIEYSMILWNDEKHTINEVEEQVAKACKKQKRFGAEKARETSDLGRSVLECSQDVALLLRRSKIIEQIKMTVTVRSSRDTFREQMCGTIIEWLGDIAGCRVGNDGNLLRQVVCEQFLKPWIRGSSASNAVVGKGGIDDLEKNEPNGLRPTVLHTFPTQTEGEPLTLAEDDSMDSDDMIDMEIDVDGDGMATNTDSDVDMSAADDGLEASEATLAGYPPPPPPPPPPLNVTRRRTSDRTPSDSDGGDTLTPRPHSTPNTIHIPHTPGNKHTTHIGRPAGHWLEKPVAHQSLNESAGEDIRRRVRLDFLLLFDLRLWKKARIGLRDLYISTVVTIPQFKRLLGLRLAASYPTLAQLYLIADREPDHSIINLSLQILTTPSITDEVVERSNFLTNLIAILYTFLTTRQVGHPHEVDANATLAFEAGSLTNRRMYHFFMDLRHLFNSSHVQNKLRNEERYTLQFLDLVKLHQGICPNTRAVGEHVEYETDAWISASLITREINKLCRQFAEPFAWKIGEDDTVISRALRLVAKTAILNSLGLERSRFSQAEIKKATAFKLLDRLEFDRDESGPGAKYEVVDFVILNQPISFHHALHYTLSWFIDGAKSMPAHKVRELLSFEGLVFRPDPAKSRTVAVRQSGQALLLAVFDFPLRVCAWLAQMKAGIWVRNGLSLRHQSSTYRGVSQRDVAHQRDIFLLQSALVICDPNVVLMSVIDRFGMYDWADCSYAFNAAFEGKQMIEVAEDFLHLLVILLSDRTSLLPTESEEDAARLAIKRDIIHVLCFKPLSFSELCGRLADRYQEMDEFQALIDEMTTYRAPEGLSDFGTFELKERYLEELDPYIAHYNKNQRDESETAYRNWMAKKLGKEVVEIVFEPRLIPISSGLFEGLAAFTSTNVFLQIIFGFLSFGLDFKNVSTTMEVGRVEAFLQVTLHLTLVAVLEDRTEEIEMSEESLQSFSYLAITKVSRKVALGRSTIANVLLRLLEYDEFNSCFPKINLILRKLKSKCPRIFHQMVTSQAISVDKMETESLASAVIEDLEAKRKRANESRAKIMAHFQKEQQNFMSMQGGIDWGVDDFSDAEEAFEDPTKGAQKSWKYPSGTCIFCQDEVNETSLFGTFSMIIDSNILRQTNLKDDDFIEEVVHTPENLDHAMDRTRPFGVSGQNIEIVQKLLPNGAVNLTGRRSLGKGFPASHVRRGPVTTGCGHIMHFTCFEHYYQATMRRQNHQIARAHPERITRKEFVCPLCKAIGNAFLPIIWKSKTEEFPGAVEATDDFDSWLSSGIGPLVSRLGKVVEGEGPEKQVISRCQDAFSSYTSRTFTPSLGHRMDKHISRGSRESTSIPPLLGTAEGAFPQAGPRQDFTIPQLVPNPDLVEVHELFAMYKRLRDTIKLNNLANLYTYPPTSGGSGEDFTYSDTLAKTLGFSISSAEIAHRGVPLESGSIWLESLPEQTLTHLRIFSETALSYIAVGGLRRANNNKSIVEYTDMQRRQLHQLFIGHPQIFEQGRPVPDLQLFEPLLLQDIFVFLAESTMFLVPALNLDVHHIMRICYLAEMVKVILGLLNDRQNVLSTLRRLTHSETPLLPLSQIQHQTTMTAVHQIHTFQFEVAGSGSPWTLQELDECAPLFYRLFKAYALPFLRKSALLLHARYSVDFSKMGSSVAELPEVERLSKRLRLPAIDEILRSLGGPFGLETPATPIIMSLTIGWMRHWRWSQEGRRPQLRKTISLSHPAILELVGLPDTFDVLIEQVMKRRCPTTGKDMVDPSVCLFCGDIFCSQALCCLQNGTYGGCNSHVEK
jgi:E3 ubiquitin-protein ligase UBR1